MKTFLLQSTYGYKPLILLIFILWYSPFVSFSTEIQPDSLYIKLNETNDFLEKYSLHEQIAHHFWTSIPDSSHFHIDKAEEIAKKIKDVEKIIEAQILRGSLFLDGGQYHKAIEVYNAVLEQTNESTEAGIMARIMSNIGNSYSLINDLPKAIEYYRKAIDYIETSNNISDMSVLLGRLGNLYYINRNFDDAINYYKKAGDLFNKLQKHTGEAITIMNIGNCFKQLNAIDSAITYYSSALKQFQSIGNLPLNEAQCLANLGNIHFEIDKKTEALKYLLNADSLFNIIQNPYSIAQVNSDLAYLYLALNNPAKAKESIDKCLDIAKKNKYNRFIETSFRLLWKYYDHLNDCNNAYTWLFNYFKIKDSLETINRKENIDFLLTQFETERKEKEIEILKQSEKINRLELRRKTFVQYLTLLGLLVALSFIAFLYLNNQRRKRINNLLTKQNAEINLQKEEILSQRDEIESQRNILQDQNYLLEEFRLHTTHSLRYAQSIQAAILPSEKVLKEISTDYFIMMKPCELVSGDFYWATTFDEYHVFCVADCTGHGVPGAFMSILGLTALNDIVARHRVTKPSEVLGYLRESVIEALSQNDPEQLHKDGLDIALCIFNSRTRELQYAGAKIPLWIVSQNDSNVELYENNLKTIVNNGFSLFEIKGDIMPVGQSPRRLAFTNHSYSLKDSSISIYLATDGFADQLGGNNNSKFSSSALKSLILNNTNKPFVKQSELLSKTFDDWKDKHFQVDDATILGIKL